MQKIIQIACIPAFTYPNGETISEVLFALTDKGKLYHLFQKQWIEMEGIPDEDMQECSEEDVTQPDKNTHVDQQAETKRLKEVLHKFCFYRIKTIGLE